MDRLQPPQPTKGRKAAEIGWAEHVPTRRRFRRILISLELWVRSSLTSGHECADDRGDDKDGCKFEHRRIVERILLRVSKQLERVMFTDTSSLGRGQRRPELAIPQSLSKGEVRKKRIGFPRSSHCTDPVYAHKLFMLQHLLILSVHFFPSLRLGLSSAVRF